jgi:hypothetical protein
MMKRLEDFLEKVKGRSKTYIGYPAGTDFDYKELYPLMDYSLNNVGDPYTQSNDMTSKEFETEVVSFFADYFNAPKNNYWGYESVSGSRSTVRYTENIREEIPKIITQFNIKSIFDAPCGDFNWIYFLLNKIKINYIGADSVPDIIESHKLNSEIRYFLTITHKNNIKFKNKNIKTGDFRLIDLFSYPFNFPDNPIARIDDWIAP